MTEQDKSYLHEAEKMAAREAANSLADARESEDLNRMLHDFGGGQRPDVSNVVVRPLSEIVGRGESSAPRGRGLAREIGEISFGDEGSSGAVLGSDLIDGFGRGREMDRNGSGEIYYSK